MATFIILHWALDIVHLAGRAGIFKMQNVKCKISKYQISKLAADRPTALARLAPKILQARA
jgi:hypothetical protein